MYCLKAVVFSSFLHSMTVPDMSQVDVTPFSPTTYSVSERCEVIIWKSLDLITDIPLMQNCCLVNVVLV